MTEYVFQLRMRHAGRRHGESGQSDNSGYQKGSESKQYVDKGHDKQYKGRFIGVGY